MLIGHFGFSLCNTNKDDFDADFRKDIIENRIILLKRLIKSKMIKKEK